MSTNQLKWFFAQYDVLVEHEDYEFFEHEGKIHFVVSDFLSTYVPRVNNEYDETVMGLMESKIKIEQGINKYHYIVQGELMENKEKVQLALDCLENNMYNEAEEILEDLIQEDGVGGAIGGGVGLASVLTTTGASAYDSGNTMPIVAPKNWKKKKTKKIRVSGQDWLDKDVKKHAKKVTNKYVHLMGNAIGQ